MRLKLVVVLGLILTFAIPCIAALTFTDVPKDHWAYNYVDKLVTEYKVISGYPDNTFKGKKTLNRYEFAKALVASLQYIENTQKVNLKAKTVKEIKFKDVKETHWAYPYLMDLVSKYQIISGYPDGTFKGKKTLNRNEVCVAVARALGRVEKAAKSPVELKEVSFTDLPPKHWAYPSVQKLVSAGIVSGYKDGTFKGKGPVSRYLLAGILVKFIDYSIKKLEKAPAVSGVGKSLEITSKPVATISGGWGNINESASGTNNWMGLSASATYGDIFKIWMLSGNYEVAGKYSYNQINYMTPAGGGALNSTIANENRYELELNTIYPVVKFYGIDGKLLVGLKYINLSNPTAPTDFTGLNLGLATSVKVFERNLLTRFFWSLPVARVNVTPSALGQPSQLFDYEVSLDAVVFSCPILVGLSGEIMTLSGTANPRYYNTLFVRYFLL